MHGKLCIVGCTRSGTVYVTRLLQHLGLKVEHEYPGPDGCIGFNFAFDRRLIVGDATNVARPGRAGLTFDHLWHQVRHPLKAIGSMHTHNSGTWAMIADGLCWERMPKTVIRCAARYWIELNRLAEDIADITYQIEDVADGSEVFEEMCRRLEMPAYWPNVRLTRNTRAHKRSYRRIEWGDLEREAAGLYPDVRELAVHYGYEV